MGKFKTLLFLFTVFTYAQNKTIIPKKGIIVFISKENVFDKNLYDKSKKEFANNFLKAVTASIKNEKKQVNIDKNNEITPENAPFLAEFILNTLSEDNNTKYSVEYQDSIINKVVVKNDVEETSLYINPKTRTFDNGFTQGFYDFSKNKIISIKEYQNITKIIGDYKCYKVVYSYFEKDGDDDYNAFINQYKTTRELWVTDKIKSEFHPIINDKQILTKYYPLEIIEFSDMVKGINKIYKIDTINIY